MLVQSSEADGVSQYQRTTVTVFLSLSLHLIWEGKPQNIGAAFPLNPKHEITNPKITQMLCGSSDNHLL